MQAKLPSAISREVSEPTQKASQTIGRAAEGLLGGVPQAQPTGPVVASVLRRRVELPPPADALATGRRAGGAMIMAAIAIAVLVYRRSSYDNFFYLALETFLCTAVVCGAAWGVRRVPVIVNNKSVSGGKSNPWLVLLVTLAISLPWLVDRLARSAGAGNGLEIVMLSCLAWGSVSAAWVGQRSRTISLSVVCSGFLTLFTTFISESTTATLFAYAWGIVCLWWLVANHWEQVEACQTTSVRPSRSQRVVVIGVGCLSFLLATVLVSNRLPMLRKLQAEIMPTSGGTTAKDPAAMRGVGNGDALIAAREHATSFGAVETDFFLDSEQPSLFDVFSDEFGEPKQNERVEKAQALSPLDRRTDEGKFADANRSSGTDSFSIHRDVPRQRPEVEDLTSEALMFWAGETGVRLAVQRFSRFDGRSWHNHSSNESQPSNTPTVGSKDMRYGATPESIEIGERAWFKPTGRTVQNSISPFVRSLPEALKFTRYRSPIIPTRAGLQLWSIDHVTRSDFFEFSADECLSMSEREHVPDYTVVRFVNSRIDLERLEDLLQNCSPGKSHTELSDNCRSTLAKFAHQFAGEHPRGWEQVGAVILRLRNDFRLARTLPSYEASADGESSSKLSLSAAATGLMHGHDSPASLDSSNIFEPTPLELFFAQRQGPSYLFATAAALMLEHLGYQTRLVTGFYVNPHHYLARDSEIAVLPRDAHVWLEINAGHGYWIPLEPTPGYREPRYSASLWYRLLKARVVIAQVFSLLLGLIVGVYLLRRFLFEIACRLVWPVVSMLDDRRRIVWLTRVLDIRLRLAGTPRSPGTIPRAVLLNSNQSWPKELAMQLKQFFAESDQLCFGGMPSISNEASGAIRHLWKRLTIGEIRRNASQPSKEKP